MLYLTQHKRCLYYDRPATAADRSAISDSMKKGPTAKPTASAAEIVLTPYEAPSLREEPADRPPPGDCSYFVCGAGHLWTPRLGIADCGCQARQPVVAAQFTNCPVCNEPPVRARIRVDITTMAIGVPRLCAGQTAASVTGYLDLEIPHE